MENTTTAATAGGDSTTLHARRSTTTAQVSGTGRENSLSQQQQQQQPPLYGPYTTTNNQNDDGDDDGDNEAEDRRRLRKRQAETLCTVLVHELDPRSIIKWPAYFAHSVAVACQVIATARFVKPVDVIAGLINACLLFTFAAVFSSAIFGDIGLDQYVALGTGCNLVSTVILQGAFVLYSDAGVNVAGPDFNPTIFLATMASMIKDEMIANKRAQQAASGHRRLLSSSTASPTSPDEAVNPEAILATILAMIMIASATFGVFLYLLGRLKISRGIQLVPGALLAGFMACIGYLVAFKAIKTTMPHDVWDSGAADPMFWAFFLPSLPIGVLMYLQRRLNWGNPIIFLPAILITPLVLFYVVVYASGSDLEQARADGWLFAAFQSENFYSQLVQSYGRYELVDWAAVSTTAPTMVTMMIIVAIEMLLKQATTRKILKAHDLRLDHEIMLAGKANILSALCAGVVGYPQPKLVAVHYAIVRNSTSRVGGMIIVVFNAAFFFAGFPLINYLPRFWQSGILFFAAAGFLVENLIDSFWYYSLKEFICIWAIMIVNAVLGLLWAVIVGVVLAALIFALAYSRGGAIKAIFSGADYRSGVYRSRQEEQKLNHLASKAIVVQLHRYIFFGSAAYVNEVVSGLMKEQDTKCTEVRRASHFIFDWQKVENVDMTAMGVFSELMLRLLAAPASGMQPRTVIFTGLTPKLRRKLQQQNVVQQIFPAGRVRTAAAKSTSASEDAARGITGHDRRCFDTLDRGMEFVEDQLLAWSVQVRQRWFHYPALQDFYCQANYWNVKHSFDQILVQLLGEQQLGRFFDQVRIKQQYTVCKQGELNHNLYVLTEGSLTVLLEKKQQQRRRPNITRLQTLRPGAFVNEDSLYEDFAVPYTVVADVDSTVLCLSREGMQRLERDFPLVSIEIHRRVLNHSNRSRRKVVSMLHSLSLWDQEFAPTAAAVTASAEAEEADTSSTDSGGGGGGPLTPNTHSGDAGGEEDTPSTPKQAPASPPPSLAAVAPLAEFSSLDDDDVEAQQAASSSPRTPGRQTRQAASVSQHTAASTTVGSLIESTKEAAHAVSHFSSAVVNAGMALSGLKEDTTGEVRDSLFNMDRDGDGEEDGRLFAQRLLRRRSSALASSATAVFGSVQAFRAQKGLLADDDAGEAAVGAIYQHIFAIGATIARDDDEEENRPSYCLHPTLLQDARTAFVKAAGGAGRMHAESTIPRRKLNVALAGAGLFSSQSAEDAAGVVTWDEFVALAVELNSPALSADVVARLARFFATAASSSKLLHSQALQRVLPAGLSPLACDRFINVWGAGGGGGGVDFNALCSAVAHHVKTVEMDFQVEAAWRELANGTEFAHTEDLASKLGLDLLKTQEMVWEADLNTTDALSLFELLETLSFGHAVVASGSDGGGDDEADDDKQQPAEVVQEEQDHH